MQNTSFSGSRVKKKGESVLMRRTIPKVQLLQYGYESFCGTFALFWHGLCCKGLPSYWLFGSVSNFKAGAPLFLNSVTAFLRFKEWRMKALLNLPKKTSAIVCVSSHSLFCFTMTFSADTILIRYNLCPQNVYMSHTLIKCKTQHHNLLRWISAPYYSRDNVTGRMVADPEKEWHCLW